MYLEINRKNTHLKYIHMWVMSVLRGQPPLSYTGKAKWDCLREPLEKVFFASRSPPLLLHNSRSQACSKIPHIEITLCWERWAGAHQPFFTIPLLCNHPGTFQAYAELGSNTPVALSHLPSVPFSIWELCPGLRTGMYRKPRPRGIMHFWWQEIPLGKDEAPW